MFREPYAAWESELVTLVNIYFHLTGIWIRDEEFRDIANRSYGFEGSDRFDPTYALEYLRLVKTDEILIHSIKELAVWKFYEGSTIKEDNFYSFGLIKTPLSVIRTINLDPEYQYIYGDTLMVFLNQKNSETIPTWNIRSYKIK